LIPVPYVLMVDTDGYVVSPGASSAWMVKQQPAALLVSAPTGGTTNVMPRTHGEMAFTPRVMLLVPLGSPMYARDDVASVYCDTARRGDRCPRARFFSGTRWA
jgi:hypothetical protein